MNRYQRIVSEYVRKKKHVSESELRNLLKKEGMAEDEIDEVLVNSIISEAKNLKVSVFGLNKIIYNVLSYDRDIVVREEILKGVLGLQPPSTSELIPPQKHQCILPSPQTIVKIPIRHYYFCPTEKDKLDILLKSLYQ